MKQHKTDHKISTVGQDDFPEYEGKTIVYKGYDEDKTALIVGCNRSVGVTLVDANDKDNYIYCQSGPVAPGYVKGYEEAEEIAFDYCLEAFDAGVFDIKEFWRRVSITAYGGPASASVCAYSQ
jgi:hypothetical protein